MEYVRYERPSIINKFENKITKVKSYEDLYDKLLNIDGTILNTTWKQEYRKASFYEVKK